MSSKGTLYFLIGKMGAGKSTYSSKLADDVGAVLISEDEWLTQLYPDEVQTFDDFIVRHCRLLEVVGPHVQQLLSSGCSVVLDFPANTVNDRQWYLGVALAAGASHQGIYIDRPDATCLKQIAKRRIEQPERAKFDTPELFEHVTQFFEEPSEGENLNLVVIS